MADIAVYSGAAGAANGADFTNAYTTLAAAVAAALAGDKIWVAHDHAAVFATGNTQIFTFAGTAASPVEVRCVNRAGSWPPVAADIRTTATESGEGASGFTFASGHYIWEGVSLTAGSGVSAASISVATAAAEHQGDVRNCSMAIGNTNTTSRISVGGVSATAQSGWRTKDVAFVFGAVAQGFAIGMLRWENEGGSVALTGSVPTTMALAGTARANRVTFRGVDLSALSGNLVGDFAARVEFFFLDCKTHATAVPAVAQTSVGGAIVYVLRSDSSTGYYRSDIYHPLAVETTETTIVRTGGATDTATGQAVAKKIVTTALASPTRPYRSRVDVYNATTGSNVIPTVYGVWGGGAVPNNDDVWTEARYMGSALTPLASFASSGKANDLATETALTADAVSTWGGGTTKFKIPLTLSAPQPAAAGLIGLDVCVGIPSTTVYIDGKVELA